MWPVRPSTTLSPTPPTAVVTVGSPAEAASANTSGEHFGEESLQSFLTQRGELRTEDFADALLAAVGDWAHRGRTGSLDDDVTLIVIDVVPSSA